MPGLYRDEGIVLRTIKLGEADRIVTLFTRANGKVRAVAKGIRKTKSRFGGRLEPFTRAELMIYRGRDLDTITSVDIVTSFDDVRDDFERIVHAHAMVDLVDKITPERERAVSVYSLLLSGLEALARGGGDSVVVAFTVKMLSVCGYHPHLQTCTACGEREPLVAFSAALGGAVCERCRTEDRGAIAMETAHIGLLSRLLTSDFGHPADAVSVAALTRALKSYAEYHLERPLRSLTFLAGT
jgi:DNA repair protein RecO (recombination protein O)